MRYFSPFSTPGKGFLMRFLGLQEEDGHLSYPCYRFSRQRGPALVISFLETDPLFLIKACMAWRKMRLSLL